MKHDLQLEFASHGCAVCEDFLADMEDDPAYPVLKMLLEGGGSELFWFEEVISVKVHHVAVAVGCFVSHCGEGHAEPCLASMGAKALAQETVVLAQQVVVLAQLS